MMLKKWMDIRLSPTAPDLPSIVAVEEIPFIQWRPSLKGPDSSVGRATDWKSVCRWFNSTSGHQQYQGFADFPDFEKSISTQIIQIIS